MNEGYYNSKGDLVTKDEFDKERKLILEERFSDLKNKENLIPYEDMDYYLGELRKLWNN